MAKGKLDVKFMNLDVFKALLTLKFESYLFSSL